MANLLSISWPFYSLFFIYTSSALFFSSLMYAFFPITSFWFIFCCKKHLTGPSAFLPRTFLFFSRPHYIRALGQLTVSFHLARLLTSIFFLILKKKLAFFLLRARVVKNMLWKRVMNFKKNVPEFGKVHECEKNHKF